MFPFYFLGCVILCRHLLIIPGEVSIFSFQFYVFLSLTLALPDMSHTILQPCFIGPPAETQTSHNFSNQVGWPFLDDSALELFPCFKFQDSPRSPGQDRMIDINHVLLGIFMPQRAPHLVTLDETKNHDVKVFFLRQGDIFCENDTLVCEIFQITPVILIYLLLTFEQKLSVRKKSPEFT